MHNYYNILLATIILGLYTTCIQAQDAVDEPMSAAQIQQLCSEAEQSFHEAGELPDDKYQQSIALYKQAIARYEKILNAEKFRNGKLYCNLANAYFRCHDLGNAILNYRLAEKYLPNDQTIIRNLNIARQNRTDNFQTPEHKKILKTVFFWHYDFNATTRQKLFIFVHFIFWGSAIFLIYKKFFALKIIAAASAVCALALGTSLAIDTNEQLNHTECVIIADAVTARQGDGNSYAPAFTEQLHAGTEAIVLQTRHGWLQIKLPDSSVAWLPDNTAKIIQ